MDAGSQRIPRRVKKAFLSEQCKERGENNSLGKTRDLFKKSGDFKGTFHAQMSTINDRNDKDLTEAEDIKKRWQEYTEIKYTDIIHRYKKYMDINTQYPEIRYTV